MEASDIDDLAEKLALLEKDTTELQLFDLKDDSGPDQSNLDNEALANDDINVLPSGIPYFDANRYGNLYTKEILCQNFFKTDTFKKYKSKYEDKQCIIKILELMMASQKMSETKYSNDLATFIFQLLSTELSDKESEMCIKILVHISEDHSCVSCLEITLDKFSNSLQNLGGKYYKTLELENLGEKLLTYNEDSENWDKLIANFKNIIRTLTIFISRNVDNHHILKNIQVNQLQSIVFSILAAAQDPRIIVHKSDFCGKINNVIHLILSIYPEERFLELMVDMCMFTGHYWDMNYGSDHFNHCHASFVLLNLLPESPRGQMLRSSLAFYSLTCIICEESVAFEVLSVSDIYDCCYSNTNKVKNLGAGSLWSVFILVDAAIKKPIEKEEVNDLKKLSQWLSMMLASCAQANHHKIQLGGMVKTLVENWAFLTDVNKSKNPAIQKKITEYSKGVSDIYGDTHC